MGEQTGEQNQGGEQEPTTTQQQVYTPKQTLVGCLGVIIVVVLGGVLFWNVVVGGMTDRHNEINLIATEQANWIHTVSSFGRAEGSFIDDLQSLPPQQLSHGAGIMVEQWFINGSHLSRPSDHNNDWANDDKKVEKVKAELIRIIVKHVEENR